MNIEMHDKIIKLEDNKTKLLRVNNELKLAARDKEDKLKKKVLLKNKLEEEKKQIEAWYPQVQLYNDKFTHLLLMCEKHNEKCTNFVPLWGEYYDKHEQAKAEENAE